MTPMLALTSIGVFLFKIFKPKETDTVDKTPIS